MKKILNIGLIGLGLFVIVSCQPEVHTVNLNFDSKLTDGKKLKLVYEISFEKKSSCAKFNNESEKIKYALSMIFSKLHSKELVNNGKLKAENSLSIILKRHFAEKTKNVQIKDFHINAG